MELLADIIGIIGTLMIVLAYFLMQNGKMHGTSWSYLWLNLAGALMLLYSLFWFWNLASVIIEIFWIGITIYGMIKKIRDGKNDNITT